MKNITQKQNAGDENFFLSVSELNEIAVNLCKEVLKDDFTGYIVWSNRMVKIAGNCNSEGRIALNRKYYDRYGKEEIVGVLKHELAHYYVFKTYGLHNHETHLFKETLKKLKGPSVGKPMPRKVHLYQCPNCKKIMYLPSKIEKGRFSCSKCSPNTFDPRYIVSYIGTEILELNNGKNLTKIPDKKK